MSVYSVPKGFYSYLTAEHECGVVEGDDWHNVSRWMIRLSHDEYLTLLREARFYYAHNNRNTGLANSAKATIKALIAQRETPALRCLTDEDVTD